MTEWLEFVVGLDTRWVLAGLLAALDVWAVGLIVRARPGVRVGVLWSAIVLVCPIIGCLFWYVLGPKPLPPDAEAAVGIGPAGSRSG